MLTARERMIAVVANSISAYITRYMGGELPERVSMYEFVLKTVPVEDRRGLTPEIIDDVLESITAAHNNS